MSYIAYGVTETASCQTQHELAEAIHKANGVIGNRIQLSGSVYYGESNSLQQLVCDSDCIACEFDNHCEMQGDGYSVPVCV